MALDDIVGYTFNADIYCADHILRNVPIEEMTNSPYGWDHEYDIEFELDGAARSLGIDRENESSFDSGDFPKVIFRDQAELSGCGECGRLLIHFIHGEYRPAS